MTSTSDRFRYALGIALVVLAAGGVVADLLGHETIRPSHYGALFALGFGIVPDPHLLCALPSRIVGTLRP